MATLIYGGNGQTPAWSGRTGNNAIPVGWTWKGHPADCQCGTCVPRDDVHVSHAVRALELATAMLRDAVGTVEVIGDDGNVRNVTIPPLAIVVKRDDRAWGHITYAEVWQGERNRAREVMISGENLARGAVSVFGTLAHECAHALNMAGHVRDADGNGRHNMKFRYRAEGVFGLTIEQHPVIGWSPTTVPVETQVRWQDVIDVIAAGIKGYCANPLAGFGTLVPPPTGTPVGGRTRAPGKVDRNNPKFTCGCGEILRMSRKAYDRCRPVCSECDEPFTEA